MRPNEIKQEINKLNLGGWVNPACNHFLEQASNFVSKAEESAMRVKYFSDTDTALVEFTDHEVDETKEISETIYVDLDREGNLVSMTIEQARTNARLLEFSYQEIATPLQGEG